MISYPKLLHSPYRCFFSFQLQRNAHRFTKSGRSWGGISNFLPKQLPQLLNHKSAFLNLHIQMHMAIYQSNAETRKTFKRWTSFREQAMTKETKILIIHASTPQHTICLLHQTISSPLPQIVIQDMYFVYSYSQYILQCREGFKNITYELKCISPYTELYLFKHFSVHNVKHHATSNCIAKALKYAKSKNNVHL